MAPVVVDFSSSHRRHSHHAVAVVPPHSRRH
jgi:hypothetical protein